MIKIGEVLVSDDVVEKEFVCNLDKCKGACCVEGDFGAPLNEDELPILEEIYPIVKPYLTKDAIRVIEKLGTHTTDDDGDLCTPVIDGRECVYAIYDKQGILKCGIEQAYLDGKITWKKPISCHLYPIRITSKKNFEALNYNKWHICSPACVLGKELQVPVYKFLKEPLIRKYGEQWYGELEQAVEERPKKEKKAPKK
ncbi:DUF3109 family protein [Parachryseolinea silvisoli]|jgi:hypothetical protein|uniref:DUF3109 family protein n=1 Tax=Parachryseolinea silvisoli TaxID=2873601 RepID=UPI002265F74A|nr:DUF3109 family protein [Parachryseolinea silvisoli]MCD9014497.1 DUF3109 family protein [Parachryseolinea silvisoli]